jgi:hypothetical protein
MLQNTTLENPNVAKHNIGMLQNTTLEEKIPTPNHNKETKQSGSASFGLFESTDGNQGNQLAAPMEKEAGKLIGEKRTAVPPPMELPFAASPQGLQNATKGERIDLALCDTPEGVEKLFKMALRGELEMKRPADSSALCELFLRRWCLLWGKRRTIVSGSREKAWRGILKKYSVQDFAEAMIGMAYDPWKDRRHHCDWKYIQREMGQWLDLYEKHKGQPLPESIAVVGKTKIISGVVVPENYVWKSTDEQAAQMGYKFNLKTMKWESP